MVWASGVGSEVKGYETFVAVSAADINATKVSDHDLVATVAVSADGQAAFFLLKHSLAEEFSAHKGVGKSPGGLWVSLEHPLKRQVVGYGYDCFSPLGCPAELLSEAIGQ